MNKEQVQQKPVIQQRPTACFAGVRKEALQALSRFCSVQSVITLAGSWVEQYCHSVNLPVTLIDKSKKQDTFNFLAKQKCRLVLSAGFPFILPSHIITGGPLYINSHPALLPSYKGFSPIREAYNNNEEHMGVTVHYMVPEVDDGNIIIQEKALVKDMTLQEIYDLLFGVVEPMAVTKAMGILIKEGLLGK